MTLPIGIKIQQIRENANLSISDLADASGIAVEQIEMIESGKLAPSISTLIKISRRMGVRLGTILDGEEQNSPTVSKSDELKPVVSTSNGDSSLRKHLNFYSLARNKSDRNMEPFMVTVEYKSPQEAECSTHEGEEFIYVLDGEVELRYGSSHYKLEKGDSIYYDSIVPHCLSTTEDGLTAQVLAVTYTPH